MAKNNIRIKSITEQKMHPDTPNIEKEKKEQDVPKIKLGWRWLVLLIMIIVFGGLTGILADRFLFPYLVTMPFFENYEFLKPRETQIIVQKEKEVLLQESDVLISAVKKVKPAVVSVVSKEEINKILDKTQDTKPKTGFVVTSDGIILTNSEVVSSSEQKYLVITSDGRNYEVKDIFFDPASDIVFLKILADNLPVVDLGVSDDLQLGQKVVILGAAFLEFQNFVTSGIVSGLNRSIRSGLNEEKLDEMIFTDAQINPKNSGGPLFDLSGKVLGLVCQKETDGKRLSYVIPIDFIKKPLGDVIKKGKIVRPKLGIRYVKITPDLAQIKNLPKSYGIFLPQNYEMKSVTPGGPAAQAGLRRGDIILAIGEKEIKESISLIRILEEFDVGSDIEVIYIRARKEHKAKVRLGE